MVAQGSSTTVTIHAWVYTGEQTRETDMHPCTHTHLDALEGDECKLSMTISRPCTGTWVDQMSPLG